MRKIKIIFIPQMPEGSVPKDIQEQWVGVEIPLAFNLMLKGGEYYQVKGKDAVQSLIDAGKIEAVNFWRLYEVAIFHFEKGVCELI